VLCKRYFSLFYTKASGEYAASVVAVASFTWMLKIKAANCFENCWPNRGEEEGPDQFIVSV
jgi:hypothetical protein